jgi:hypothetical protein
MKIITFSNEQKLTNNLAELKKQPEFSKAQKGKWYHFQRFYVVKSANSEAYGLVALNFFERLARNICHVNYFKKSFKERSISVISPKNLKTPTVQKVENVQPQIKNMTKDPIPLEKTGGCENAGSNCFVATSLQIIKQIPIVAEHLKAEYHLKPEGGESDQQFDIRKQIKDSLASMISKSMQGQTVLKGEMVDLQDLLSKYTPNEIPQAGNPGSEYSVLMQIFRILEIPCDMEFIRDSEDKDYHLEKLKQPTNAPVFILKQYTKGPKESKNTLLTDPLPILEMPSIQPHALNTYQLIGAVIGLPGHAVACLKDIQNDQNNSWISFDDNTVRKEEKLNAVYQEFTSTLVYTRLDKN